MLFQLNVHNLHWCRNEDQFYIHQIGHNRDRNIVHHCLRRLEQIRLEEERLEAFKRKMEEYEYIKKPSK